MITIHMSSTARSITRRAKTQVAALLCIAISLAATMAMASPASAAYTTRSAVVYAGPSHFTYAYGLVLSGRYVRMNCWVDSIWSLGTNRWFHISGWGWNHRTGRAAPMSGFVSANLIRQQTRVRHC